MTELKSLNLSGNLIIDINGLKNNKKLTCLDLSNNYITKLHNTSSILDLDNLEILSLANNSITGTYSTLCFCE